MKLQHLLVSLLLTSTLSHATTDSIGNKRAAVHPTASTAQDTNAQPWETLPPTPTLPEAQVTDYAEINGIKMWYAIYGDASDDTVVLIHESYGNANYWGEIVAPLSKNHQVIVMDTRSHGRTNADDRPLSYDLMASDIIALMDNLKVASAAIIGWGDGANIATNIAIHHPERISKLLAFGGNIQPAENVNDVYKSDGFSAYIHRSKGEYLALSPTPTVDAYNELAKQIMHMWSTEPHITTQQLAAIKTPTLIAGGDHDGAISFDSDTITMASTIPNAGLLIQPFVSHFSVLENPEQFSEDSLRFLDQDAD